MPRPSAAARAAVAGCAGVGVAGAGGVAVPWGWNAGGDTIVPAGVPGATVGALGAACACARPRERLLQQRPDLLGALVLQAEDVEARALAEAGLVEAVDPLLRFVEVRRLRRDDEQRVQSLDRDDPEDSRQRARRPVAQRLVELLHHRLDVDVLQREQSHRHAGHPVEVEHVDRVEQIPELALGAGEDQQVAQIVGAHGRGVLGERLDDPHHLAHADIAQRHDLHREPGRQRPLRIAELRSDIAAHAGGARHDLVQARLLHHRRAVHAQQRLERRDQRLARDARRRADRDLAAHGRIDRVALVHDVAQDVPDDLAQVCPFEVEHDRAARLLHRGGPGGSPPPGCCPFTTTPVPLNRRAFSSAVGSPGAWARSAASASAGEPTIGCLVRSGVVRCVVAPAPPASSCGVAHAPTRMAATSGSIQVAEDLLVMFASMACRTRRVGIVGDDHCVLLRLAPAARSR